MLNKVMIIGRVGQDPTIRQAGGRNVASFTVATSENWTKDGQKNERTEWHRIVAWGALADICGKYLAKGKTVFVEGKLQTRKWADKAGVEKQTTEIVADAMRMLSGPGDDQGRYEPGADEAPF